MVNPPIARRTTRCSGLVIKSSGVDNPVVASYGPQSLARDSLHEISDDWEIQRAYLNMEAR